MAKAVWTDPEYLRTVQYGDPGRLTARATLHRRYGTSDVQWFPWLASQVEWPPDADVLDVGCGPGWLWTHGAPNLPPGLHLTLADLSPSMSDVAFARVSEVGRYASLESREADVQELPFGPASFDVVVANHMLYHVPDPVRAVAEIARVLRPGGTVLAATNGPGNLRELRQVIVEVFGGSDQERATMPFNKRTGVGVLCSQFSDVTWREYDDVLHCTGVDELVEYVASSPTGERASERQMDALRATLQRRLDDGGGVFTVSKETGAFVAAGRPTAA